LPGWITRFAAELDRPAPVGVQKEIQADGASFMTINEVAAALRVSTRTVRRLIASERLACVRLGRAVRIPREAVEWPGRALD
jgi:excisionase family DNA binding protein